MFHSHILIQALPLFTQGPKQVAARAQLKSAISSVNSGIGAGVTQLSAAIPKVKFVLLDWNSLTQEISEYNSVKLQCDYKGT